MAAEAAIVGYRRVADSNACPFCVEADGAFFRIDEPMALHNNCGCTVEPQTAVPKSEEALSPEVALADRAMDDVFEEFGDKLSRAQKVGYTQEDIDALSNYCGQADSFKVNKMLRGQMAWSGEPITGVGEARSWEGWLNQLDAAFNRLGPIGEPVRVWRGVGLSPAQLRKMVGMAPDEELVGVVLEEPAFSSASSEQSWASQFLSSGDQKSTLFDLTVDAKTKAVWGANMGEHELVIERGARYVITKVTDEGSRWLINAHVLPPA